MFNHLSSFSNSFKDFLPTTSSSSSSVFATSICFFSLAGFYYLYNANTYWSRKGVKGPKPLPLLGNFLHFISDTRLKDELNFVKQYGKVYGTFMGVVPKLVIADAELMTQICQRDFEIFPNHELSEFSSKISHQTLIKLKDGHWKRTRALMSPTFTSSKIKRMFQFMDGCAEDLIKCVEEQFSEEDSPELRKAVIDVKETYNLFTMDTITTCCYGLKLERCGQKDLKTVATRNEFVSHAMKVFEIPILRTMIKVCFPDSFLDSIGFKVTKDSELEPVEKLVKHLMKQRRENTGKKYDDYLQLLIDARMGDEMELNEMDSKESHHVGLTRDTMMKNQEQLIRDLGEGSEKMTLTNEEIIANAIFLLAVGIETTSSLLANCTYCLAFHPEVQERLHDEILQLAKFDETKKKFTFEYDSLTSCRYLDAVLSETLRRLTPVVMLDRVATRDYYIEKYNINIPKNLQLYLGFHLVHNDPDYWPEPERFDPERFMPGNREKIVPGSYCPFGLGPRHCIGMRFSLTEAKLALAKMVLRYRFEPAAGKSFPPEPKMVLAVSSFKDPLVAVRFRS